MKTSVKAALLRLGYEVRRVEDSSTLTAGFRERLRSLFSTRDTSYTVGQVEISLPAQHALPKFRRKWRLYDEPLRFVADGLRAMRGEFKAVDIGANVGDSAALLNAGGRTAVLCVEGDPVYLPYLERNSALLGPQIVVERCFVDSHEGFADPRLLERGAGTTSAVGALTKAAAEGIPVHRLDAILERHPSFLRAELIKVDTDGRDFDIILAHERYFGRHLPVLFFEYALTYSTNASEQALQCIKMLLKIGYQRLVLFDNFGNRLVSTGTAGIFEDLNPYLLSNQRYGTAVYYFDVCAIAEADHGLDGYLLKRTHDLVSVPIRGHPGA
jgi:FkbM family methyltransferase